MEPVNLADLSAKELKVIAKDKGLTFMANASAKDMLVLLEASAGDPPLPLEDQLNGPEDDEDDDEDTSGSGDEPKPMDWIDGKRPEGQYNVLTNVKRHGKIYGP